MTHSEPDEARIIRNALAQGSRAMQALGWTQANVFPDRALGALLEQLDEAGKALDATTLALKPREGEFPWEAAERLRGLEEQLETLRGTLERIAALDGDDMGMSAPGPEHYNALGIAADIAREALNPANSPNGEQAREQLLERLALTVKDAIDGGGFEGTLFESQVSGTLWLLYGEQSPASRPPVRRGLGDAVDSSSVPSASEGLTKEEIETVADYLFGKKDA